MVEDLGRARAEVRSQKALLTPYQPGRFMSRRPCGVCVIAVPRRWRSRFLVHFTQRCRAGLTNFAAPRLVSVRFWTTATREIEL